jgi:hypothetical protein
MFLRRFSVALATVLFSSIYGYSEDPNSPVVTEPTAMSPLVPHPGDKGWGGRLSVSYIYWSADEDALEFAMSGIAPQSTTAVIEKGKVYVPRHKWESGFKVGSCVFTPWDGWDLSAEYTRFLTTRQRTALSAIPGMLRKIWQTSVSFTVLSQGAASWSLHFSDIDLALGRSYYISSQFSVHPFVGLKGSWQDQEYNVSYDGTTASGAPIAPPQGTNMNQKQQMWAIGALVGADMYWRFWKPFSIFGKLAASILSEEFRVRRHVNRASPVLEAVIGFEVEKWAYNDKIRFTLKTAYEYQLWMDQNQFIRTSLDSPGSWGDLSLQGLTIEAGIEF